MRWLIAGAALVACSVSAFAQDMSGTLSLNYDHVVQQDEGAESSQDSYLKNLDLRLNKSVTPMISYQFSIRGTEREEMSYAAATTSQKSFEPAVDMYLYNPFYNISAGVRRREQWMSSGQTDADRTDDFFYSRLSVAPQDLPSLSLQVDRQRESEQLTSEEEDSTTDRYSATSGYRAIFPGGEASYNFSYAHTLSDTPFDIIEKTVQDGYNLQYMLRRSGTFQDKTSFTMNYQANYSANRITQQVTQEGVVSLERTPLRGLYALGTEREPSVDTPASRSELIDDDYYTAVSEINIGPSGQEFQNIGLELTSSEKAVSRIRLYVNRDVRQDSVLLSTEAWKAFWSNTDIPGTEWNEIPLQSVSASEYDALYGIYYYELEFATPHNATHFKVVNMLTSGVLGAIDVTATEIEAFGDDEFTGTETESSTSFSQEVSLDVSTRPRQDLALTLYYSVKRTDTDPVSPINSTAKLLENIYTKSAGGQDDAESSSVTRSFSSGAIWTVDRLLTPSVRFSRSETFSADHQTDYSTNSYLAAFASAPLPTLDLNLSFNRSDSSSFGDKVYTNDSVLLTAGTKLLPGLSMITDTGFTASHSYTSESRSHSRFIRGSLDALFNSALSGNFSYGITWSSSNTESSMTKQVSAVIAYRPGRLISFSIPVSASHTDGKLTSSEGLAIDWLPLPAIRLGGSYLHERSEEGPTRSDSGSVNGTWYVTKFIDARITYSFALQETSGERTEAYAYGADLNWRF